MKIFGQSITQNRKRLLITAVLCILVAGAALIGFRANWAFTLDNALALLGTELPDGATAVEFATRANPTRIFWLRFSLESEDDAAAFWEQAGSHPPQDGFTPFPQPNFYEAEMAWWQPFTETFSGSYTNTGRLVIETLVDRSRAAAVVVYLRAYRLQ